MMDPTLYTVTTWALPVIFAITLHEAAHGWVAEQFGDPTARNLGRITANPIKHIDPMGTIALPAILLAIQAPVMFGYAKPVPVATGFLHPRRLGMLLVAFAGPASNLFMALLCGLALALLPHEQTWLTENLFHGVLINAMLMVFNMLPILPLDGGRVLRALLPGRLGNLYATTEPIGMVLVLVLAVVPSLGVLDLIYEGVAFAVQGVMGLTGRLG